MPVQQNPKMKRPSNFDFLESNWKSLYDYCRTAEANAHTAPRTSGIYNRLALEYLVNWLYDNDSDFERPYEKNLYALMKHWSFRENINQRRFGQFDYVRRIGNLASHDSDEPPTANQALNATQELYSIVKWLVKTYDDGDTPFKLFDNSLVPTATQAELTSQQIKKLLATIKERDEAIRQKNAELAQSETEKAALKVKAEAIAAHKAANKDAEIIPAPRTEAQTRALYIDAYLQEVGWSLAHPNVKEYKITGLPRRTHPSGYGFADYVLWGNDGKPLAVIEAKRTSENADRGRMQAKHYADALERQFGQRPVIFYSNGFETFIWDDVLSKTPRRVIGFYSQEDLQRLVDRRKLRQPLKNIQVKLHIVDRYYQKEAITRIADILENNGRGALLVMATGSGKTRTSAALVEVLMRYNWVSRVLFLADRNALVTQALNSYNGLLPDVPSIDLTKDKAAIGSRLVFSTYPTMMNAIENGSFSTGYFDLIIVDEAHRSVYNRYRAIFDYFDAMKIGLTATPKKDIDHDTYNLFDCSEDNPTYAYELPQAVQDKFLVRPDAYKTPTVVYRDGVTYSKLSDAEKEEYEATFRDEATQNLPDKIEGKVFIKKLYNKPTILEMLQFLMDYGLSVDNGALVGKTIIFARNHAHAELIRDVFEEYFTEYDSGFIEVIDNYNATAQESINQFRNVEKYPQIAVSVDMLDTGIDVPDILNLVFFKVVRSSTKYWQMVGRGTRLRPDIFGPDKDKDCFLIFDFCQNIEFFEHNIEGKATRSSKSIIQKIFEARVQLAFLLQNTTEYDDLRHELLNELHQNVMDLDAKNPRYRKASRAIDYYQKRNNWNTLDNDKVKTLYRDIADLPSAEGKDNAARRFDLAALLTQIAIVSDDDIQIRKMTSQLRSMTKGLQQKKTIPTVADALPTVNKIQAERFEEEIGVEVVEGIRKELRSLLFYLKEERNSQQAIYTNFEDTIDFDKVEEVNLLETYATLEDYKARVQRFVRNNKTHLTIYKLRNNQQITAHDLTALEQILFDGGKRGTKEDFEKTYGKEPLGRFIRKIVGMNVNAAKAAFSEFLESGHLSGDQLQFINTIIDHLTKEGFIDKSRLAESPYKEINSGGIMSIFPRAAAFKIVKIINEVNENVG